MSDASIAIPPNVPLKGEGKTKFVISTLCRIACEECGEPATLRHTYLRPNARSNPASSAYHKDDCRWCSDAEVFRCADCGQGHAPALEGFERCGTFMLGSGIDHMFLKWQERSANEMLGALLAVLKEINLACGQSLDRLHPIAIQAEGATAAIGKALGTKP